MNVTDSCSEAFGFLPTNTGTFSPQSVSLSLHRLPNSDFGISIYVYFTYRYIHSLINWRNPEFLFYTFIGRFVEQTHVGRSRIIEERGKQEGNERPFRWEEKRYKIEGSQTPPCRPSNWNSTRIKVKAKMLGSNAWVSNPRPTNLYYVARRYIRKLFM